MNQNFYLGIPRENLAFDPRPSYSAGHVRRKTPRLAAPCGDFSGHGAQPLLIARYQRNARPFGREGQRHGFAQSFAGAGNDGSSVLKSALHATVPCCERLRISSASDCGLSTFSMVSPLASPEVSSDRLPTPNIRCIRLWSTRTSCSLES